MKRRFITLFISVISLLTACARNNVRSDIKEFIASFSIDLAMQNYPAASYKREEISIENDVTSKVITMMSFNRKDAHNLAYDYTSITLEDEVEKSHIHRYIEKKDNKYLYFSENETLEKNEEQVNSIIDKFFYTSSLEGIYTGGMYMGDNFKDIIPDIQDLVTIDDENKLLVYSYVNLMSDQNKEVKITQTVSLDQYGMLIKEDMQKTSDLGVYETHIEVKKE